MPCIKINKVKVISVICSMLQQSKWKIMFVIRNSIYTLQSDVWLNANEPHLAKCLLKNSVSAKDDHHWLEKILTFVFNKNKLSTGDESVLWGKLFSTTRVRSQSQLKSLLSKYTKFVTFFTFCLMVVGD